MEDEGREGSEKQVVEAAKKMMMARSGSKNAGAAAPVRGRRHGRRWSSSTDLDIIETASAAAAVTTTHTPTAAAAVLGRSYSTSAAIAVAVDVDGGVKQQQQQAAPEGEGEEAGEQRPRRRCGAGARLSRKIKEHRARFYIIRRCVAMLVCWRDADE